MAGIRASSAWVGLLLVSLTRLAAAQNATMTGPTPEFNKMRTLSIGIAVFPGWEPLDVFGPLELFYSSSGSHKITLSIIAKEAGPVSTRIPPFRGVTGDFWDISGGADVSIVATHSFYNAPALDVLLVPGGLGNFGLEQNNDTSVDDFVRKRFDSLDYLLSVCTGAVVLANAGVLEGRRATSNKGLFAWVSSHGKNVTWVPTARWVVDGKVWTSSGVAAGIDMVYAFLNHVYGEDDAGTKATMNGIEYAPHTNPHWDPFSVVHKVPGADMNSTLESCVKPVGY